MACLDAQTLAAVARRRYERGRWVWGLRRAIWAVPVGALLLLLGAPTALVAVLVPIIAALIATMSWRGLGWDRGALVGLAAGGVAGALAVAAQSLDVCCTGEASTPCLLMCAVGGLVAGGVVSTVVLRSSGHTGRVVAGAATIAALTATMGCAVGGLLGLGAMAVGIAALATPTTLWKATRSQP